MTETIEWGQPIATNGVRPEWLGDETSSLQINNGTEFWRSPLRVNPVSTWLWHYIEAIRLPANHPYYTVQRHNAEHGDCMVYWPGGDQAPGDYLPGAQGALMFRTGLVAQTINPVWEHRYGESDIIAYRPRAQPTEPASLPNGWTEQTLTARVEALIDQDSPYRLLKQYVAQHETPPVDPREALIRECCAETEAVLGDLLSRNPAEVANFAIRLWIERAGA